MKGIAERIAMLRIESGKSDAELADQLGISIYEYGDIEAYDDEIIDAVPLETAVKLAALYQVSLLGLIVPNRQLWPEENFSPQYLAEKVIEVVNKKGISIGEAEDQVGWHLSEFLSNPNDFIKEQPLTFIKDLTSFLSVPWLCAVPRETSS